jgi:hypothetical protein
MIKDSGLKKKEEESPLEAHTEVESGECVTESGEEALRTVATGPILSEA